jgi:hypothetical protein
MIRLDKLAKSLRQPAVEKGIDLEIVGLLG